MKVGVVVQARMSSSRFPGKILHPVHGKPLLWYLLSSLRCCTHSDLLVVATSDEASDDPVEAFCLAEGVECFRGPLADVAYRFRLVVEAYELDSFVRICGDSPLLDHRLVDHAITLCRHERCDVVSNILPRSFPKGQSVEVINADAYLRAESEMADLSDREHVTQFLYANQKDFKFQSFESKVDFSDVRHVVDTEEDMDRFTCVVSCMDRPHTEYEWQELVALSEKGGCA